MVTTKTRHKARRAVSAATRPARAQALRRRTAQAIHTPWLSTDTGKMVAWGLAGFVGILVVGGIAAALVETGALDTPEVRHLQARLKAIPQSKTPQEALSWFNHQIGALRDEFQAQMARFA